MKTLTVIESAKELFDFANRTRPVDDDTPWLPADATLVFENNMKTVQLQKAGDFVLSDEVNATEIISEAIKRSDLNIHIT